jgi:small multidrug resistance family-3 protein
MKSLAVYILAALCEIGGCFAFWGWLRLGKHFWWLGPGVIVLIFFAALLTFVDSAVARRVYGAIYIVS